MAKKSQQPKKLKSWERRAWPKKGDRSLNKLYASVGRALTQWEIFEGVLSLLYSYFVVSEASIIARRAYNAVRTFEGREQMLRAASSAYFSLYPNDDLQDDFKEIIKIAHELSPRRNEIAHGAAGFFRPQHLSKRWRPRTYALYPSYANFKDRDVTGETPEYCYTTRELDYFFGEFYRLVNPTNLISGQLLLAAKVHSSQKKPVMRYPASTNQAAGQTS